LKVSILSVYALNICAGMKFDVNVPADLDQFGRDNSHGTIIGGKGLVQLSHDTTNGR